MIVYIRKRLAVFTNVISFHTKFSITKECNFRPILSKTTHRTAYKHICGFPLIKITQHTSCIQNTTRQPKLSLMASTLPCKLVVLIIVIVLGLWASTAWSRDLHEATMRERHEQWMARHGQVYKDVAEKERRFQIFKDNVELIESSNRGGNKPYSLGINRFADLTNEEFKAFRTGYKRSSSPRPSSAKAFRYENVAAVPASMDWRKKGAVTPVKDQGQCGKASN